MRNECGVDHRYTLPRSLKERKAGTAMKQLTENQMLVVRRYWVRSGEPPLGYATHRYYPLIGLIGTTLLAALVVAFLIMRAETLVVLSVAVLVLFSVASMLLIRRYSGWY